MANLTYVSTKKLIDLLSEADPARALSVKIISTSRLALGTDPLKPTKTIDLSKENVENLPPQEPLKDAANSLKSSVSRLGTRKSGDYWWEIRGRRKEFHNLRGLLGEGLLAIEDEQPGTLEKLSLLGKRKKIVSRNRQLLFQQKHLVEKFSSELANGWWFGTNNSSQETSQWLKRACELAGLSWGREFRVGP